MSQLKQKKILEALSDVKILDPACGSGAFPMGALHKIINALQKLDPDATWWKERQIENVPNALAKQMLKEKLDGESADYVRKLGVIQNSIYGVDIQPIASEISKLRSFLSLVIDETIIDEAENRGIQALPNLEFKFVTANTLIGLEKEEQTQGAFDFGQTDKLQDQLKTIRNRYLQAYGEEKIKLKKDFDNVQTKILKQEISGGGQNKRALQLASWKPFGNESNSWFDPYWMYGVEKFDIVIGNPPYIFSRENLNHSKKSIYKSLFSLTQFKLNLYILFIEKAYNLIDEKGTLNYIIPNNWLTVPTNSDLRKFILTQTRNINIVQNYSNVFQQASVDTLLLNFCKNGTESLSYYEWANGTPVKRLSNNTEFYLKNKSHIISVSSNINQELTFLLNLEGKELKDLCEVRNGVQAYTVGEGKPVCTEVMKNNRVYHDMKNNGQHWIKYLDGSDIGRYKYNWTGIFIKYGDNLARKRKPYLFEGERILVRQIPSKLPYAINATIVDDNAVNDNNLMIIKINEPTLKISYLLGLLNSKLISIWFAIKFDKLSRKIFPQFKINELRIFPIIIPSDSLQQKVEALVNSVLKNYLKNVDTKKEEDLIDILIYRIYKLTYEEIKIIEPEFNLTKEEYNNYQIN
ncbi:Eco57I restriction-modification methylase domain-containing protein [Zobellia nedashkovskayae]